MKGAYLIVAILAVAILPLSTGNVLVVQSRNIIYAPSAITPYQWFSINQTITYKDVTTLEHIGLEFTANGYEYPTDYVNATEFTNSTSVSSAGLPVFANGTRTGNVSHYADVISGDDSCVDQEALSETIFLYTNNGSHPPGEPPDFPYYGFTFSFPGELVTVVYITVITNGTINIFDNLQGAEIYYDYNDASALVVASANGSYVLYGNYEHALYFTASPEHVGVINVTISLAKMGHGAFRHDVSTSLFLQPVGETWKDTYYPENGTSVHITLNTTADIQKIQCTFNGEDYTDSINSGETSDLGTLHMNEIDGGLQNITLSVNASKQYLQFNFDGKNRWVDTGIATVHYVFIYDNSTGQFFRYIPFFGNYSPYLDVSACTININNDTHTITVQWVIRLSPMAAAGQWTVKSTAYFSDGSISNSTTTTVNYWVSYIVSPDEFWWQTTSPNSTGVPIVSPSDGYLKINWSSNTPVSLTINRTAFNYTGDPFVVHLDNASGVEITTATPVLARTFDRVHREYFIVENVTFYLDVGDVPDGFYRTTINFWMEV